jgi:Flp pilus assembly protein TadD
MSVINRVLKDLDRKGMAAATPAGVRAVQASLEARRPRWPWLVLLLAGMACAWALWPGAKTASAPTAVAEVGPRLRLSQTLSSPARPAATVTEPRSMEQPVAAPTHHPDPTKPPTAPADKGRPHPEAPSAEAVAGRAEAPLPVKLDTRLPEPRAPKVVKENHPLTPHEQADQAWRQASRLIEQGRGREAPELLAAALALDPGHGPARQTLIALCLETGDTARGEALLREGMQLHGNDPWYHRGLAQLYLQRGDTAQSLATLKAGLAKGADGAYWGLYAGVLGKAGKATEAAAAYREATRLDPGHGPWWIGLAVSLEQAGARTEAGAAYQRALQARLTPEVRDYATKKAAELAP